MAPRKVRPIRIEGNVAFVQLTMGYEAVIDAVEAPLVGQWNWTALLQPHSNTVYAYRHDCSGPKKRNVRMHRLIAGDPPGLDVDHRDGNGLNNRRSNLRAATKSQNAHNARLSRRNSSGAKGVYWSNRAQRWIVEIRLHGQRHYVGTFVRLDDASSAYASASARLHGEFGRTG